MSETADLSRLFQELKVIKEDVTFIKKHMFDPDTIMTTEEARIFEQSIKEFKAGKTTPISKLKKELGI